MRDGNFDSRHHLHCYLHVCLHGAYSCAQYSAVPMSVVLIYVLYRMN